MFTCPDCQRTFTETAAAGPCPHCALERALAMGGAGSPPAQDFEFVDELGRGGMGVVTLVRQRSLDRLVALKVISGRAAAGQEARLLREARAAAAIQHPHVVAVHEVGRTGAGAFIAMEYCEGGDLREHLRRGPMPPRAAAELARKLADAITRAHAAGVLHRDLKPSNILLTAAGEPKLADFGLSASLAGHTAELTRAGELAGSPAYLAPELLAGRPPTVAVDVYGLGAVLYECLTGRAPFTGDSTAAILAQIERQEPVRPRALVPGVNPDLETIVLKCLEKAPAARYANAAALHADLVAYLGGRPITARPVSALGRAWRWARREPALATVLGLLVFGGFAAAGILAERNARLRDALARSEAAETRTRQALHDALLAQARAIRQSGREGQRYETLRLAREAAAINGASAAARKEALAALALEDWQWLGQSPAYPQLGSSTQIDFSPDLATYVLLDAARTAPEIRDAKTHAVVRTLTAAVDAPISIVRLGTQAGWVSAYYQGERQAVWGPGDAQARWVYAPKNVDYGALRLADDGSGWWFTGPNHRLGWHDARTGAERWFGSEKERLYDISPSPDGRRVALVRDDRLEVWDCTDDRLVWAVPADVGFAAASWSADGRWLATDRKVGANELVIWDARTGQEVQVLRGGQLRSRFIRFHPDGRRVLQVDADSILRIWDLWTGRELVRGTAGGLGLRVDPAGRRVALGYGVRQVGLLELADQDVVRPLVLAAPSEGTWRAAATSPDGRWLLSSTNQSFVLWSAATGREVLRHEFGRDERANAVFHPDDGSVVYSGLRTGVFRRRLVEGPDGGPAWGEETRVEARPRTLVRAISAPGGAWWVEDYQRENGFCWAGGDPAREQMISAGSDYGMLIPSPRGNWIAGSQPQEPGAGVVAWPANRLVAKLPTTSPVWSEFSPDEQWLVLSGNDSQVVWRVGEWSRPAFTLPADQRGALYGSALFTRDSRRVALTTGLHEISVAQVGDWRPQWTLTLPAGTTCEAWTWSADGETLVVFGSERQILAWHLPATRAQLTRHGLE